MAIVPARMSLELYDAFGGGGVATQSLIVSDVSTLAAANTALALFATNFQTISNAGIKGGTFTLLNNAVAVAPGATSDIGFGAVIDFLDAALDPRVYGLLISSFLQSLVDSNGTIDITSGPVADFITYMLTEPLGGSFTDSKFLDLTAGLDAFRTNRKLRRRLRP